MDLSDYLGEFLFLYISLPDRALASEVLGHLHLISSPRYSLTFYRYPACSPNAVGLELCGHAKGPVMCSFSCDGQYLYTAGSMDGSVIIWNLSYPAVSPKKLKLGRMSSFDL